MSPKSKQAKSQELASRLEFARLQQITAESNLENARERARLAKRRRKEAKQAFRRARKEVKRAKTELARSEELIVETEAKLAKATKVQARRHSSAKRRPKVHASQARPNLLPGKPAASPDRKRVGRKDQPPPIPAAAESAPAGRLAPELGKPQESPAVI